MDFLQIIMLILQVKLIFTHRSKSKKYEASSSEETIENLLYFKDCQRKPTTPTTTTATPAPLRQPPPPPPPPRQPECPFPKMCCSLSCGNDCSSGGVREPSFMSRQSETTPNLQRQGLSNSLQSIQSIQQMLQPRQPNVMAVQPQVRKRKKMKFPVGNMQLPIGSGRRDFGFTKEKIKTLISQDQDIRKILKDLVRVTMQKVDLLDKLNDRWSDDITEGTTETSTGTTSEYLDDDYAE